MQTLPYIHPYTVPTHTHSWTHHTHTQPLLGTDSPTSPPLTPTYTDKGRHQHRRSHSNTVNIQTGDAKAQPALRQMPRHTQTQTHSPKDMEMHLLRPETPAHGDHRYTLIHTTHLPHLCMQILPRTCRHSHSHTLSPFGSP